MVPVEFFLELRGACLFWGTHKTVGKWNLRISAGIYIFSENLNYLLFYMFSRKLVQHKNGAFVKCFTLGIVRHTCSTLVMPLSLAAHGIIPAACMCHCHRPSVNRSRLGHGHWLMVMLTPWLARAALMDPLAVRPIISISRSPVSGDRDGEIMHRPRLSASWCDVRGRACAVIRFPVGALRDAALGREPAAGDHVTQRHTGPYNVVLRTPRLRSDGYSTSFWRTEVDTPCILYLNLIILLYYCT